MLPASILLKGIPRGDITIFSENFWTIFFRKTHHGVQEALLDKGKIKITRYSKVKFVKMPKNVENFDF